MASQSDQDRSNEWIEKYEQGPVDIDIPDNINGDEFVKLYMTNYNNALQALHNMKQIIYNIVDRNELDNNVAERLVKIDNMKEQDYRIYYVSDFVINAGNSLVCSKQQLDILTRIIKDHGSLDNFDHLTQLQQLIYLARNRN